MPQVPILGPGKATNPSLPVPHAILNSVMKWLLILVVAVVFLGSLIADYKWRKWIADRKRDRQ